MKNASFVAGFGGLLMVCICAAVVVALAGFAGLVLAPSELWPGVVFGAGLVSVCVLSLVLVSLVLVVEK